MTHKTVEGLQLELEALGGKVGSGLVSPKSDLSLPQLAHQAQDLSASLRGLDKLDRRVESLKTCHNKFRARKGRYDRKRLCHTSEPELIATAKLESFRDGRSRKITLQSIRRYVERKLARPSDVSPRRTLAADRAGKEQR